MQTISYTAMHKLTVCVDIIEFKNWELMSHFKTHTLSLSLSLSRLKTDILKSKHIARVH